MGVSQTASTSLSVKTWLVKGRNQPARDRTGNNGPAKSCAPAGRWRWVNIDREEFEFRPDAAIDRLMTWFKGVSHHSELLNDFRRLPREIITMPSNLVLWQ
ncbi:hypothetical protein RRG08_014233 [Elysia crispata]|uniref:Uncharacterized protein n=1 Tax=Elysia crispata TaxID=231223 RepID=A0AAE0XES2_9GAST|nr:hypothetical protein RRG08_014233 [Elysia crispata]